MLKPKLSIDMVVLWAEVKGKLVEALTNQSIQGMNAYCYLSKSLVGDE